MSHTMQTTDKERGAQRGNPLCPDCGRTLTLHTKSESFGYDLPTDDDAPWEEQAKAAIEAHGE